MGRAPGTCAQEQLDCGMRLVVAEPPDPTLPAALRCCGVSDHFIAPDVLVLASGGTLGEAWMSGLLAGVEDASGHDFRSDGGADRHVGRVARRGGARRGPAPAAPEAPAGDLR